MLLDLASLVYRQQPTGGVLVGVVHPVPPPTALRASGTLRFTVTVGGQPRRVTASYAQRYPLDVSGHMTGGVVVPVRAKLRELRDIEELVVLGELRSS